MLMCCFCVGLVLVLVLEIGLGIGPGIVLDGMGTSARAAWATGLPRYVVTSAGAIDCK